jgi:hypothetical protein
VNDGANAGTGRPGAASAGRLAVVVVLTLLVILGVRAVPPVRWDPGHGPWHVDGLAIALGLEAVLAGLLTWLTWLRKRRPQCGWIAGRLRGALAILIPALMVACGVALLRYLSLPKPKVKPRRLAPIPVPTPKLPKPGTGLPGWFSIITLVSAIVALAFLAAAIFVVIMILRRRLRAPRRGQELPADEASIVRQAVEAGRSALAGVSDARLAIIACYLAMEASLDKAGATRGPAQTADELLARSTAEGLLHGAPPARLTALFSEARFSRHEVPDSARTQALQALEEILADLTSGAATRERQAQQEEVAP